MALIASKNAILLKGSVDIISEFFDCAINSILYQRGLYPPETFTRVQKYGLTLLVTTNEEIKAFLNNVMTQVQVWMMSKVVKRLVLVIADIATKEVLERWDFVIECEKELDNGGPKEKNVKEINKEISAVIRQITASVTFLPLLETACSFDLLIYTEKDLELPNNWNDTAPCFISNSEEVRLRSFSTSVHKLDTIVSYQNKN